MQDCDHDWCHTGETICLEFVLDDWLGPTIAIVRCSHCEQSALLYLLAWQGQQLSERIFAISDLAPDIVETYRTNVSRDYCDLTRKQLETDALVNTRAGISSVISTVVPGLTVSACRTGLKSPAVLPWREIEASAWDIWHDRIEDHT